MLYHLIILYLYEICQIDCWITFFILSILENFHDDQKSIALSYIVAGHSSGHLFFLGGYGTHISFSH